MILRLRTKLIISIKLQTSQRVSPCTSKQTITGRSEMWKTRVGPSTTPATFSWWCPTCLYDIMGKEMPERHCHLRQCFIWTVVFWMDGGSNEPWCRQSTRFQATSWIWLSYIVVLFYHYLFLHIIFSFLSWIF